MSITGYKRLAFALACLCICLLLILAYGLREYLHVRAVASKSGVLKADLRYAHDIIMSFEMDRDLALKSNVTNAVEQLYKLQAPPRPFENPAAQFVERERKRAVRDVISYLRLKTGQNLGDEPAPWILAYGNDGLKMNQAAREEISAEIEEVRKGITAK